jgi:hypothetical protein
VDSNPAEDDGFFKGDKNHLSPEGSKILCHVKEPFEVCKRYFIRLNPFIPLPVDSAGSIARELWWTNQEFSSVDIILPWFSMLVCYLGDEH